MAVSVECGNADFGIKIFYRYFKIKKKKIPDSTVSNNVCRTILDHTDLVIN